MIILPIVLAYYLQYDLWVYRKGISMEKQIEDALSKILLSFYEKLEDIAYNKYEITAADIIDFSKEYDRKVILRANGIIDSLTEAYQTFANEYGNLIRLTYQIPPELERHKADGAILSWHKKFDRVLRIIRVKAMVAFEDIRDNSIHFEKREILEQIVHITFEKIMDSLIHNSPKLFVID
jgi:hypothetical protein